MDRSATDLIRLPRRIRLGDGTMLMLRAIRSDDEERLHDTFERMSERSVYLRFFSPLKRLPEGLAHRLANVDYQDRFALVASSKDKDDGREVLQGVARYDRIAGTTSAEVAIAVVDDLQGRGLGSELLLRLAAMARASGITEFMLMVLPENQSMLRLLQRLGWSHHTQLMAGTYQISFDISAG